MRLLAFICSEVVALGLAVALILWGHFDGPAWWVTVAVLAFCIVWIGQDLAERRKRDH